MVVGRPGVPLVVVRPDMPLLTLGSTLGETFESGTNASPLLPLVIGLACMANRLPLRSWPGTVVGRTDVRGAATPPIHGRESAGCVGEARP